MSAKGSRHSMKPTARITVFKYCIKPRSSGNILCPVVPSVKEKSHVYLCASWDAWSLKCNMERLDRQNRKFAPILITTEAKNAHFFKCTRSGFIYQEIRDFVKMTLTRVSSHFVKNVTRVEWTFFSTWLESSPSHQKSWLESSHWLESRYHCGQDRDFQPIVIESECKTKT